MSSQGANGTTIAAGYAFDVDTTRDASDWIARKKQSIVYNAPKLVQTTDPWIPYANGFRLTYLSGRFKCATCNGGAYNGNGVPF